MARTKPSAFGDLPTIYDIDFAVGPDQANGYVDVLLIQTLMKLANFTRFTPAVGPVEASRSIKVDGIFGPQTKRMIKAFEEDRKKARMQLIDDGMFEPSPADGFTKSGHQYKIVHLNRMAKNATPFGNEYNQLPFEATTHPVLRTALAKGAVKPKPAVF